MQLYCFSDTKMDRKDKLFIINEVIYKIFLLSLEIFQEDF